MKKIALITGASGGVARQLIDTLRSQGVLIAAVGRDASRLQSLDVQLRIEADATTPQGCSDAFEQSKLFFDSPATCFAHCIGNTLIAPMHRTSIDAYREIMRVNLDSAFYALQAWLIQLQGSPGSAVLTSSVVARIGVANHEAIAAAKAGIEGLARSAAATYASLGVRVNAVAPGLTDTPLTASMLKVPAMREAASRQYPLGGVQTAQNVADVMAWLLGDQASRVTGQTIAVDGGFTVVRPLIK